MTAKKRIEAIDVAKGIAIIFVVASHTLLKEDMLNWIYSFCVRMPLFFIFAGMFFKPEKYKNFGAFMYDKLKTLICPYVLFAGIGTVIHLMGNIMSGITVKDAALFVLKNIAIIIWAPGSSYFHTVDTPLWFVPCLFMTMIIYYFLSKIKNPTVMALLTVLIVVFGWFTESKYCPIDFSLLPWNFSSACFVLGFFVLGKISFPFIKEKYFDVEQSVKFTFVKIVLFVLTFAIAFIFADINGSASIGSRRLNNGFWLYIIGICGTAAMLILGDFLKKSRFLKYCGSHTFVIMASHVLIDGVMLRVLSLASSKLGIPLLKINLSTVSGSIINFVLTFILTLVFTVIYSKTKDKILAKRNERLNAA